MNQDHYDWIIRRVAAAGVGLVLSPFVGCLIFIGGRRAWIASGATPTNWHYLLVIPVVCTLLGAVFGEQGLSILKLFLFGDPDA